ncbi:MAG: MATE family efflux transporter [Sphingobacteriales bacterium]|nr:MATE family efflux transporter [Sphingobacteriales bacterium]
MITYGNHLFYQISVQIKGTYREIWQIAFPIILGSLANSINQLIDTAFLGHYSKISLDAVTLTGIFFFNITFIAGGFARGAQVMIARHNGEMHYNKIGIAFDHLLAFSAILSVITLIFFAFASPAIVTISVKSTAIQEEALTYLKYMNIGVPAVVFGFCFNAFYSGIGKTKIITYATLLMGITNIILDYILIFGKLGFPALGIKGAAIATTIANIVLFLVYLVYFIRQQHTKTYDAFRFKVLKWLQFRKMIDLSTPIVLQNLIGITSWQYFFLCVEKLGEHELAVSGILKSLFVFLGIPVWSLGSASNTIISNIIGQRKLEDVIPALKKVILVTVGISMSLNLIILLFPRPILSLFTNDLQLIQDCIPPFYTLMIALLFFSSGMIMNQGIIGTGATKIPAMVELFCCFSYIGYCYYFIQLKKSPLYIAWGCEVVYWFSLLTFTTVYWGSGIWKRFVRHIDTITA